MAAAAAAAAEIEHRLLERLLVVACTGASALLQHTFTSSATPRPHLAPPPPAPPRSPFPPFSIVFYLFHTQYPPLAKKIVATWFYSVEQAFGLGGDERASTAPSQSMSANFIGLLEGSLGHGLWADPVASELARPLDAILAYLPPEGARVRSALQ